MTAADPLYQDVAVKVSTLIDRGTYSRGNRIPSIRELSARFGVSVNTVKSAMGVLEARGYVECRPQSGYYVLGHRAPSGRPLGAVEYMDPRQEGMCRVQAEVTRRIGTQAGSSLAVTAPDPALLPERQLIAALRRESHVFGVDTVSYAVSPGLPALREHIARRMVTAGVVVSPEDIVVTAGCTEAIGLTLSVLPPKGDAIAVESPVYFNFRSVCEHLGLRMIEVPSDPWRGVRVDVLQYVLETEPVRAFLTNPVFNNPLGFVTPTAAMREVVDLCERKGVPIVEDDVYGEIAYAGPRPPALKSFDRTGNVVYCSSFSKTLAPGYRIGWACPGRWLGAVDRLKSVSSVGTCTPAQVALAAFLRDGGYERYLRRLRRASAANMASARDAVRACFPAGTRTTEPRGGYALWVELPEDVDALELYRLALREDIVVAPGCVFSSSGRYDHCLRLNVGRWSPETTEAVRRLGELATACAGRAPERQVVGALEA